MTAATSIDVPFTTRRPIVVIISLVVLGLAVVMAIVGALVPSSLVAGDLMAARLAPGEAGHPLGTDELGRDVFWLTIKGTASALVGPAIVAIGSMMLGAIFGTLAGFERGWIDAVIGRTTDLLLAVPVLLAAVVVAGVFGAGYWATTLLLIVLFAPSDIRIVRAGILEQSARPYVEAATMLSLPKWRIMFRHLLPNVLPLVVTNLMLNFGFALVSFSALSFLGVGLPAGTPDWGRQLTDGRTIMMENPAAMLTPALLVILVATAANLVGDWIGQRIARVGG